MKTYKKKKRSEWMSFLIYGAAVVLFCLGQAVVVRAEGTLTAADMSIYSGVTVSPDKTAWTTDYLDKTDEHLPKGYTIITGQESSLQELKTGEHYYKAAVQGNLNVSKWVVTLPDPRCVHTYAAGNYYGFEATGEICEKYYNNGWNAYCADCGELVTNSIIYGKSETIANIVTVPAQAQYAYFCPHCRGLEQGVTYQHRCKRISYNHYQVQYEKNAPQSAEVQGNMPDTKHMYHNAALYEGKAAERYGYTDTRLRKNKYVCAGYVFSGWNTMPDGSGESFSDGQAVINLSEEEGAVVMLYAQWQPAKSTLLIDANGGTYAQKPVYQVVQEAETTYLLQEEKLSPPQGCLVQFETNGGSAAADIRTEQAFAYWEVQQPMQGSFTEGIYTFPDRDGNIDTIKAVYAHLQFELPNSVKPEQILVGWYLDEACSEAMFLGMPGTRVSVENDTVLYAKWEALTLVSQPDYTAFGGIGAVDLTWKQNDRGEHYYKVFQSLDKEYWQQVYKAENGTECVELSEQFGTDRQGTQYIIEHTGYYKLSAYGAQGGDYDEEWSGGKGGMVSAEYWLEKGDILTAFAGTQGSGTDGGQNGSSAAGGAAQSEKGRGGGAASEIYLTRDGVRIPLLIAGGGGGASEGTNGGNGGSILTEPGIMQGESASAGGGGGAQGGSYKGIFSQTTLENPAYEDIAFKSEITAAYRAFQDTQLYGAWHKRETNLSKYPTHYVEETDEEGAVLTGNWKKYFVNPVLTPGGLNRTVQIKKTDGTDEEYSWGDTVINMADENNPPSIYSYQNTGGSIRRFQATYPTNGNTNLVLSGVVDSWGKWLKAYMEFRILNADTGELLHKVRYVDGSVTKSGSIPGSLDVAAWGDFDVSGVEEVTVVADIYQCGEQAHTNSKILDTFFYGKEIQTGGMAEGGSSYINPDFGSRNIAYRAGENAQDGQILVESVSIGYRKEKHLEDVLAKDMEAPDKVEAYVIRPYAEDVLQVSLVEPKDYGTCYYHMVESYLPVDGTEQKTASSNVTQDILTTGVAGYFYYLDEQPTGAAGAQNQKNTSGQISVVMMQETLYLHVAAVDVAGNVGESTVIELHRQVEEHGLHTEQMTVDDTEYVYFPDERTCFVKADGETVHTLQMQAVLEGAASESFQINELQVFLQNKELNEESEEQIQVRVPHGAITQYTETFAEDSLSSTCTENIQQFLTPLFAQAKRTEYAAAVELRQAFVVPKEADAMYAYPGAGIVCESGTFASDRTEDLEHGLNILPDGEAPVIHGMEQLQSIGQLDITEQPLSIVLWAEDEKSGLDSFSVTVYNRDSGVKETFLCDEEGRVYLSIDRANPLFMGDITFSAVACDRVNNVNTVGEDGLTFTLETKLYRERKPDEAVFKAGDGAVLEIFTSGYVERLEVIFPEELVQEGMERKQIFVYEKPDLYQEESILFSIPLDAEEKEYSLVVNAYKKGQLLTSSPALVVVEGTVLDELHTRIRNNG